MLALLLTLWLGASPALADEATHLGEDIASTARRYRDTQPKLRINACNGLVEDILRDSGLEMRGGVKSLHRQMKERGWVHHRKVPLPGDIVFFDKTYDYDRDGRQNDLLTHIAVVISVDRDGTVNMVHRGSSGIKPLTLNLYHPGTRRAENGKALNSWLGKPGFAKEGHRLAGELWTAWASPTDGRRTRPVASRTVKPPPRTPAQTVVQRHRPRAQVDLPLALDDPNFVRIWQGKRMRARHLDGHSCREMWFLRNAVFARHGYDFKHKGARAIFDAVPAYRADSRVNWDSATRYMTGRDKKNVEALLAREKRCKRRR